MSFDEQAHAMWPRAYKILLPDAGGATEIFVSGLPADRLEHVLRQAQRLLGHPRYSVLADQRLDPAISQEVETVRDRIVKCATRTLTRVRGDFFGDADLTVHISWNPAKHCEVKITFWNHTAFPVTQERADHLKALARLLELAEAFRDEAVGAYCVLTTQHKGPLSEMRTMDDSVWW